MNYTPVDFTADQLRAANPSAEWSAAGIDRARELALILNRNGIVDLSRLFLIRVKVIEQDYSWVDKTERYSLALEYEGKTFGFLGTPDRSDSTPILENDTSIAWSAAGHGNVTYSVVPVPGGFAIAPLWGSSSDWGTGREIIRFYAAAIISFALPAAGIAIGETIGAAVVSAEFAAAYPALTSAIGNLAIGTAMSGGDVESAVKNLALNYAGAGVGDIVGGAVTAASEAESLGRIASSVTAAAVKGGDVNKAAAFALLREGATMDFDFDFDSDISSVNSGIDPSASIFNPTGDPLNTGFEFNDSVDGSDFRFYTTPNNPGFQVDQNVPDIAQTDRFTMPRLFDIPQLASPLAGGVFNTPPASLASETSATDIVNTVSNAALQTLKVLTAYDQLKRPVTTTARTVTPTGAVRSVNSNGTITNRTANGTAVTRAPVNQPMSTVDGNIVNNNGDGTYTVIAQNGASSTVPYPPESGFSLSSIPPAVLFGGIGLLGVFLLKRKG